MMAEQTVTFKNGNPSWVPIKAGEHNTYLVLVDGEQIGYVGGISYPHEPGKSSSRYSKPGRWMGYYLDDAGSRVHVRATGGWDRPYFNSRREAAGAMVHQLEGLVK